MPNATTHSINNMFRYTPVGIAALAALFDEIGDLSLAAKNIAAHVILQAYRCYDNLGDWFKDGALDHLYHHLHGLGDAKGQEVKNINKLIEDLVLYFEIEMASSCLPEILLFGLKHWHVSPCCMIEIIVFRSSFSDPIAMMPLAST